MISPRRAEALSLIIDRSHLPDLAPETLLAAFQAEGVRSLEDVAASLSRALRDAEERARPLAVETLFRDPAPPELLRSARRPVPRKPIIVHGERRDPAEITQFAGAELLYVPQEAGESLLILTDKATWGPFLRTLLLSRAVLSGASALEQYEYGGYTFVTPRNEPVVIVGQGPVTPGSPVPSDAPKTLTLWSDIDLSGSAMSLDSLEYYTDLTRVSWSIFGGSWNDRISSVGRTTSVSTIHEHTHFRGDVLLVGPNDFNRLNLHEEGWGDRASSVINGG